MIVSGDPYYNINPPLHVYSAMTLRPTDLEEDASHRIISNWNIAEDRSFVAFTQDAETEPEA